MRPRADIPEALWRGRPDHRRCRRRGPSRTWAPGGPGWTPRHTHRGRTAGGKDACERSSERGDRFLPRPTPQAAVAAERAAATTAVAAAAAASLAPESAAAVAVAPLPLRSPLPLWPEPRPASAPSPHWPSGARGCLGRPRGALTEGEGSRAEGRDAADAGGRKAGARSAEDAGGGGRKWGRGSGKRRWEERGRVWGEGQELGCVGTRKSGRGLRLARPEVLSA